MIGEVLLQRGTTLVRRLRLAPGEAMPWHRDPFHRITVVLSGDEILIEYRDSDEVHQIPYQYQKGKRIGMNQPTVYTMALT